MKTTLISRGNGKSSSRLRGNRAAASRTRAWTRGSACSSHAIPTSTSSSDSSSTGRNPSASACSSSVHSPTDRAIGPAWSKLGASGKQPSSETSPKLGLKPTIPQQAAGIRMEPPESEPERRVGEACRQRGRRASARPAGHPAGIRGVRHGSVVGVHRGDPVRELVQVRLSDVRVAGGFEPAHRLGRLLGHVLGVDDRAVGRRQPRRVEEILDREPRAVSSPPASRGRCR